MPKATNSPPRRGLTVALLVLGSMAAGCASPPGPPRVGGPAPEITLPALNGGRVSLASLAGKVVVVDFWATWCGPCHIQADILRQGVVPIWRPRGVEFLGIDVGEPAAVVRDFLASDPAPYPVLLDENEEAFSRLETGALPTLLVVDTAGRIVHLEAGVLDKDALGEILARAAR